MEIKRFVFDTNVLVSALVFKSKRPTEAIGQGILRGIVLASGATLKEYELKLMDEKFDLFAARATRQESLFLFTDRCILINPTETITDCRDAGDNKFLELAVAATASAIITGDKDLLDLHPFRHIPILSPADFIRWMAEIDLAS